MDAMEDKGVHCPALDAFQAAFGRHCSLAAQALHDGHSREAVRVAFAGSGENVRLRPLRLQRVELNMRGETCKAALTARGLTKGDAWRAIIAAALVSRDAVESEWGVSIPVLATTP